MPALALILFAPWFLIPSALYWLYPRQPHRRAPAPSFDAIACCCSGFAACLASLHWSFGLADRGHGLHCSAGPRPRSVAAGSLAVLTAAVLGVGIVQSTTPAP